MKVNELKAELARCSLTQKDLSQKLGISHTSVQYKVNGIRPFTVDEVLKMQKILKLSNKRRDNIFLSS